MTHNEALVLLNRIKEDIPYAFAHSEIVENSSEEFVVTMTNRQLENYLHVYVQDSLEQIHDDPVYNDYTSYGIQLLFTYQYPGKETLQVSIFGDSYTCDSPIYKTIHSIESTCTVLEYLRPPYTESSFGFDSLYINNKEGVIVTRSNKFLVRVSVNFKAGEIIVTSDVTGESTTVATNTIVMNLQSSILPLLWNSVTPRICYDKGLQNASTDHFAERLNDYIEEIWRRESKRCEDDIIE